MGNLCGIQHEYNTLYADIRGICGQAAEKENNGIALLQETGFRGVDGYVTGTVGAIGQVIGKEQAVLKNLSDSKVYKAKLKQIAELQKLPESIIGRVQGYLCGKEERYAGGTPSYKALPLETLKGVFKPFIGEEGYELSVGESVYACEYNA
jgi:hypothetical protein